MLKGKPLSLRSCERDRKTRACWSSECLEKQRLDITSTACCSDAKISHLCVFFADGNRKWPHSEHTLRRSNKSIPTGTNSCSLIVGRLSLPNVLDWKSSSFDIYVVLLAESNVA